MICPDLAVLPFETRLLFIGLWGLADKAGRLEDRPVKIKMDVFPANDVDVNEHLDLLANAGEPFIKRYEINGSRIVQIINWDKHQRPHSQESESCLPEYAAPSEPKPGKRPETVEPKANQEGLRVWCEWWNELKAKKLVAAGVRAECPSDAVSNAWNRVQRKPELRELVSRREEIEAKIKASDFVRNSSWFRPETLLGGKNKGGEFIVRKLLDGGFKNENKNSRAVVTSGTRFDPNKEIGNGF